MSAHSVSPPVEGTTWAERIDALAASGMYELSVCQPSLPRSDLYRCSSGPMIAPSGFWLLMATAFCSGSGVKSSRSPKRFANATCSSSVSCCSGKTRTAWSWKACSTAFQVAASIRERVMSVTTAPSVASIEAIRGSMGTPPRSEACGEAAMQSRASRARWQRTIPFGRLRVSDVDGFATGRFPQGGVLPSWLERIACPAGPLPPRGRRDEHYRAHLSEVPEQGDRSRAPQGPARAFHLEDARQAPVSLPRL